MRTSPGGRNCDKVPYSRQHKCMIGERDLVIVVPTNRQVDCIKIITG